MARLDNPKRLFRRAEVITLALALAVIAAYFLWSRADRPSGVAHVSIGGREVMAVELAKAPDQVIDLAEWDVPAKLEIVGGKIRFVDVACPDHICEKTGFAYFDGQTAVCMPNRTAVTIVGGTPESS